MIQALENLKLTFVDHVHFVDAGQLIDLPEEKALKLVQTVPDKARLVQPGFTVEWKTPLFGSCSGRVVEVIADHIFIEEHGVTKERVNIPIHWITNMDCSIKGV